jgi:Integrase core domain
VRGIGLERLQIAAGLLDVRGELVEVAAEGGVLPHSGEIALRGLLGSSIGLLLSFRLGLRSHGVDRRGRPVRRPGRQCFDNAAAESFWSSLKRELVHRYRATRDQARRAITAWIHRYNTRRLHSSIGRIPPIEWEISYRRQEQQAE